jgi:hypothetical protein
LSGILASLSAARTHPKFMPRISSSIATMAGCLLLWSRRCLPRRRLDPTDGGGEDYYQHGLIDFFSELGRISQCACWWAELGIRTVLWAWIILSSFGLNFFIYFLIILQNYMTVWNFSRFGNQPLCVAAAARSGRVARIVALWQGLVHVEGHDWPTNRKPLVASELKK